MAPLLNAKAWLKRRRAKCRFANKNNNNNNNKESYTPGIGYPPMRNSSQPTLIPYIPPSASSTSSEHDGPESSLETVIQDITGAATTTCLGVSYQSTALHSAAAVANGTDAVVPGPSNDYHDDYCRRYQEINQSAATLVSTFHDHRRISLQPGKPFAIAITAQSQNNHCQHPLRQKNGSHNSLPAQLLSNDILSELKNCPQVGQNRHQRNSSTPQPQKPLSTLKSSRFAASTDTLNMAETKAQEYARTVKALWQMVEDEDLAYRLADCSPVEREWLIFNHKNANFPMKPASEVGVILLENGRSSLENCRSNRAAGSGASAARGAALARIDEAVQYEPSEYGGRSKGGYRPYENSDGYSQPIIMSLPNSPVAGPIDSDPKKSRRSTLLSPMVLHSARELQKRDHITVQQRVDMEEDWRMQARLLRSQSECEDRARGVRRVHDQLIQRQRRQRGLGGAIIPEYEPTHNDFNKWYDLKEEIDDDAVPDLMNDDVRGYDLKEEFEDEEEKKQRELEEKEEMKKKELEELEQELTTLGLDRFDGMISFVEPDARVPQHQQQQQQQAQELHQQLQYQYQQLQLQLEMQRQKTIRSKKNRARAKKAAVAFADTAASSSASSDTPVMGTVSSPAILPPPPIPGNKPSSKLIVLPTSTPLPAPPANKMVLHEPRPLRPRNGRNLFSNECCDSMIIKDMPMVSAPTRIH
ncbi:hypothetical protein BGZ80_004647 [Entomortierella chlamydospora]|uniref:Uncharacterized protein n=1 Tax=Entomortierella chlamydospora TaxID=101097 RepID=A0A9P6T307_9FUNG|nr:hypothetical protein BGZ80_004647 [Entomortierella chlamydospora]